jgi:hypothetical protein
LTLVRDKVPTSPDREICTRKGVVFLITTRDPSQQTSRGNPDGRFSLLDVKPQREGSGPAASAGEHGMRLTRSKRATIGATLKINRR